MVPSALARPVPHVRRALLPLAVLAGVLGLGLDARAGGELITTVQPGSWGDASTWDQGVPQAVLDHQARVFHSVTVDTPGQSARVVSIHSDKDGMHIVAGGELDSGLTILGDTGGGNLFHHGGTSTHGDIWVGWNVVAALIVSGGNLEASLLEIGGSAGGVPWTNNSSLTVKGADADITVTQQLYVESTASIRVHPTQSGTDGLTTISAQHLWIRPGAKIRVTAEYPAEVGDSWDIVSMTTVTGDFTLEQTAPYTMALDTSTPGVIRVVVTGSPHPIVAETCETAVPLSLGLTLTGNSDWAGVEDPTTMCGLPYNVASDVWYSVSNPGATSLSLTATLDEHFSSLSLSVFDSCGGSVITCDDTNFDHFATLTVSWIVPPFTTHLLQVAASSVISGPFDLTVVDSSSPWTDLAGGTSGSAGTPLLGMTGPLTPSSFVGLDLVDGAPLELALVFISFTSTPTSFLGGSLHAFPFNELVVAATDGAGEIHGSVFFPGAASGQELWFQVGIQDPSVAVFGASLSNGIVGIAP